MDWYIVNKEYFNYLRKYDCNVGFIDYGNRLKLHIGTVLMVNDIKYYVPISSPKEKHRHMSNSLDFHKLIDYRDGILYAVVNLNNMIPVPDECLTQLKYDKIGHYRYFETPKDKTNYIYLLQKEKRIIDYYEGIIQSKAEKLYKKRLERPNSRLAKRCCNFQLLEMKSVEYIRRGYNGKK